jgi:anti-sigma regulatory factor (Ser/Thr protein kinase)
MTGTQITSEFEPDLSQRLDEQHRSNFRGGGHRTAPSDRDLGSEATEYSFVLANDQSEIGPLVEFLALEAIQASACDSMEQMKIGLALEEALVNALYHGNLEIDSDCADTEQICRHDLAQRRIGQQPYCDRRIRVEARFCRNAAVFVVRDEGPGFDPTQLPDPTDEINLSRCSGRGVYLMRSLMDEVMFNEIGNEVTMIRRFRAG